MEAGGGTDITGLLLRWNAGDRRAFAELTPIVYDQLRRMARGMLSQERPGHTLSATALVHEIYMKLVDQRQVNWEHRAHFFGTAANLMRRVLVDHARGKRAAKRGGSPEKIAPEKIDIDTDVPAAQVFLDEVISLDTALNELAGIDPRKASVVEMKFFAGMTNQEAARALGTSDATVERDWKMARAWLIQALSGKGPALGE